MRGRSLRRLSRARSGFASARRRSCAWSCARAGAGWPTPRSGAPRRQRPRRSPPRRLPHPPRPALRHAAAQPRLRPVHPRLVLLSARNLDAVYRIRRADGSVDWKLGGTPRAQSLDFLAGPFGPAGLGGQHQARRLPDGTISLHDNGTRKGRPPRALRFAHDPLARTATVIERVTDPRVAASICCGGATRLAGGHWLISWGSSPTITELTASGRPVLTLTLDSGFSYRAQSVPATLLSRAALRAGMDAMVSRRRASDP